MPGRVSLARDPISNVINEGIRRDIQIALRERRYRAALILILAGIDTMAFLDMPRGKRTAGRSGYVTWCEEHIRLPGDHQLTGLDLYGARCGMLHEYGVESTTRRDGKCRRLLYVDRCDPPVCCLPDKYPDDVMVSVFALKEAFFRGIEEFLPRVFSDAEKKPVAERRLRKLMHALPVAQSCE